MGQQNIKTSESVIAEDNEQSNLEEGDGGEVEIEGDFEYVPKTVYLAVADTRGLDGPSGSGLLSRDWDFNLEKRNAEEVEVEEWT